MGSATKDKRDIYYRLAKKQGYRARSAYKLLQINSTYNIFEDVKYTVDLCSAPGSWSQVASTFSKVISVDLQLVRPIKNTIIIQDDITSESCMKKIMKIVNSDNVWDFDGKDDNTNDMGVFSDIDKCSNINENLKQLNLETKYDKNNYKVQVDLVLCDGAPDVTGIHDLDEYFQTELLLAALNITTKIARKGAKFVGKCFRSEDTGYLVRHFYNFFENVTLVKPRSSRDSSIECFIYCENMKDCDIDPYEMNVYGEVLPVKCVGVGDFINDDAVDCNETDVENEEKSIQAPFKQAIELRRKESQMQKKNK